MFPNGRGGLISKMDVASTVAPLQALMFVESTVHCRVVMCTL